ncbi:hypothetical protein, partial [Granulicella tundricola]|uniref:Uncharacterized protein n=1 Tax=Granulicella tundricola (strain ATCC BAA-1859 / DSM 23138 / MP5ACTX9) TaxID=1198114 RepID=E8WZH1_GRATM
MASKTYAYEQILIAQTALKAAANPWTEEFPLPTIIGMLSDEIAALRQSGFSDESIAALIQKSSGIDLTAETLTSQYARPKR